MNLVLASRFQGTVVPPHGGRREFNIETPRPIGAGRGDARFKRRIRLGDAVGTASLPNLLREPPYW